MTIPIVQSNGFASHWNRSEERPRFQWAIPGLGTMLPKACALGPEVL
jgi:hypothetical protein